MTVNTGRDDYDAMIRAPMTHQGEPTWFVRGQDLLGAENVQAWAVSAFLAGVDIAVVEQALQRADAFEAYPHRKLPNADHLTEDQRKQLAFQFSRRAWRAALPANSLDDIFAAQRAADQAKAEARAAAVPRVAVTDCKHAAWTFGLHGRACPDCGTMMIEGAKA